jgi:hypothetical protein
MYIFSLIELVKRNEREAFFPLHFFFAFSLLYFYIHIGTELLMILFVYAFSELVLLILKNMAV